MSTTIITLISAIIVAVPGIISVYINLKNRKEIQTVHLMINSRLDQWLNATRLSSFAEGVKDANDIRDTQDEKNHIIENRSKTSN